MDVERMFEVIVYKAGQGVIWQRWFAKRDHALDYVRSVHSRVPGAEVSVRDRRLGALPRTPHESL